MQSYKRYRRHTIASPNSRDRLKHDSRASTHYQLLSNQRACIGRNCNFRLRRLGKSPVFRKHRSMCARSNISLHINSLGSNNAIDQADNSTAHCIIDPIRVPIVSSHGARLTGDAAAFQQVITNDPTLISRDSIIMRRSHDLINDTPQLLLRKNVDIPLIRVTKIG